MTMTLWAARLAMTKLNSTVIGLTPRFCNRSATTPTIKMPTMKAAAIQNRLRATSDGAKPITSRNQGPAQRVCSAIGVPADKATIGAKRQNSGSLRI